MTDTMRSASADVPATLGACGLLTIDLGALRDNYLALNRRAAPARAAAVVKADAYGLGAEKAVPVLVEAGCRDFFVAHFSEALKLRPLIGNNGHIFVLNGLLPGDEGPCADAGIIPVLNSVEQVARWQDEARSRGKTLSAALQFDTGMTRVGISLEDAQALLSNPAGLQGIYLEIIMSHLANADEPENPANQEQLEVMKAASALFPDVPVCFANSGGLFLSDAFHGSLCRPGIALYGGIPQNGMRENPGKPVVSLSVAVMQTRSIPAGRAIGYGGTKVSDKPMRLAVISAGYADGLPRTLSNRGAAYFNGVRLPIVGRVSMDSIILDVSALPEGTLHLGDLVELIGKDQTLEMIAEDAGTISYEILTSLGKRYRRVYLNPQPAKA